jgi:hypothetical protein
MSGSLYREDAKQGTQAPSPAPRLIPAETEHQLRTNIAIWYSKWGHFRIGRGRAAGEGLSFHPYRAWFQM